MIFSWTRPIVAGAGLVALLVPMMPGATDALTPRAERAPACTIRGTPGDDVLTGTRGRDVICGFGGDDVLRGDRGDDVLRGGSGDDVLDGDAGDDRLDGGAGDDDLLSGSPIPSAGTDWCDSRRATAGCSRGDGAAPALVRAQLSTTTVDVTGRSRDLVLSARLRDDLGVASVDLRLRGAVAEDGSETALPATHLDGRPVRLTAGTVRDGTWTRRVSVPVGLPAGTYRLIVRAVSRDRTQVEHRTGATLAVVDRQSDTDRPVLTALLRPAAGAEMSRSEPGVAEAHITDDRAGVAYVWFCYGTVRPDEIGRRVCSAGRLVSGTTTDGTWRARLDNLSALRPGKAEVDVSFGDRVGRTDGYWGPAGIAVQGGGEGIDIPHLRPIPDGRGPFTVVP